MADDIMSRLAEIYGEESAKKFDINSDISSGIANIVDGEKITKDGYLNMSGKWSEDNKKQREAQNELLKCYYDQADALNNIANLHKTVLSDIKDISAKNYLFQSREEEKLAKFRLSSFKNLYDEVNNKDREKYRLLNEEEANIYETALKNNRELTETELNRLKEIHDAKLTDAERANEYVSNLQKQSQDEIANLSARLGLTQSQGEESLAQSRLNNYKELYQYANDTDRQRYKELNDREAELYETALKNKRNLSEEELDEIKKIEKERSKLEKNDGWKQKIGDFVKQLSNQLLNSIVSTANYYTDVMYFDQALAGKKDFASAYEQNFTELAGRFGTNRQETHNYIGDSLKTINDDEILSKALNYSKEVMPAIVEASKQGFTGDEAIEIGITNALDKKIMPWLNTTSETWSYLQFNMSEDSLNQIKGQQLQLQATREGNRILNTGIVDTLTQQFAPLLASIELNTTSKEDLGEFYAIAQAQLGDGATESMIKETAKSMYDAVYKPFDALTKGTVADKLRVMGYMQTGSVSGMENYLYNAVGRNIEGMGDNRISIGALLNATGINTYAHTQSGADAAMTNISESSQFLPVDDISNEELSKKYEETVESAVGKITATQEHDNKIQNEYAQGILDALLKPHAADIDIKIFEEVKAIKTWLITQFLSNLLSGLINKGFDKLLGGGSKGGSVPGTSGKSLFSSGKGDTSAVLSPKASGAISGGLAAAGGAAIGISMTYADSQEYTAMHLEGKDAAKNTEQYQAYKKSLEEKHKAKMAGAITGGVVGVAGGAVAGAAIGSVVPVVGTAIGGIVGGAIGLIGSLIGAEVGDMATELNSVLSVAAVESLDSLDILKTNWAEEVVERQNLVSAMQQATDLETKKRMLLDAGIDSNLVNMAKTDEALQSLAESALIESQGNAKLSQTATGFLTEINSEADSNFLKTIGNEYIYDNNDSGLMEDRMHDLADTMGIAGVDAKNVEKIKDAASDSWWWGYGKDDLNEDMKLVKGFMTKDAAIQLAYKYGVEYDTVDEINYNKLINAITLKDKNAAIEAIKMLKLDKITGYDKTTWELIKERPDFTDPLKEMGIDVNSYRIGSTYIPYDQLALLHAGERVLTEGQNKEYTDELISGESSSITQTGVQGIVAAIEKQTKDIIAYFTTYGTLNSSTSMHARTLLPEMGNTRVIR